MHAAGDKVVICAGFHASLDLLEAAIASRGWGVLRLDGRVGADKRQGLVDRFNRDASVFAFLLATRAGGTGFNLIGANRLVLYDSDWNPAADQQAMARVWREGQRRQCFIWRMLSADTIEEKVYQRQISKRRLGTAVEAAGAREAAGDGGGGVGVSGGGGGGGFSAEELRLLFEPPTSSKCSTLELLLHGKEDAAAIAARCEVSAWRDELPDPLLRGAVASDAELRTHLTYACDAAFLEALGDGDGDAAEAEPSEPSDGAEPDETEMGGSAGEDGGGEDGGSWCSDLSLEGDKERVQADAQHKRARPRRCIESSDDEE